MVNSKSSLAIVLSKLERFENPKVQDEQYDTESEIAANILWDAFMKNDISGKTVADLGSGTGILGIGAALLGAQKVFMVEKDEDAIAVCRRNIESVSEKYPEIKDSIEIIHSDILGFCEKVDIVIQNPPFGTKEKHADKPFLEKAFSISDKVYSFHKSSTNNFVEKIAKDHGFIIKEEFRFNFPLKASMEFHRVKIQRIEVSCFVFAKL